MSIRIRAARKIDLPRARRMLVEAGLPVADLVEGHLAFVAESREQVVGVIGFEHLGRFGLLRSLAVAEDARSGGIARKLVATLETAARTRNIEEVWLLTIDAEPYFAGLGYDARERADAPQAIRNTAEFAGLCPANAVLMCKSLTTCT